MSDTPLVAPLNDVEAMHQMVIATLRAEIARDVAIIQSEKAGLDTIHPDSVRILGTKVEVARKLIRKAVDLNGLLAPGERLDENDNPALLGVEFMRTQVVCGPYLAHRAPHEER